MEPSAAASWLLQREGLRGQLTRLTGGFEQAVFLADDVVVRVCPAYREAAQLAAAWQAAELLAQREPGLVVAPIRLADGELLARQGPFTVSLWPRVHGVPCSRDSRPARQRAAEALARLHTAAAAITGPTLRSDIDLVALLPAELRDHDLEAWYAKRPAVGRLVHGDFYPGNVLWVPSAGRVAVIDWDEVRTDDPARELAWAAWEFCHTADGTDLDHRAAEEFVERYARYAPLPDSLPEDLIPWMRWHLAYEIGRALRERSHGNPIDLDYLKEECRALKRLRSTSAKWRDAA